MSRRFDGDRVERGRGAPALRAAVVGALAATLATLAVVAAPSGAQSIDELNTRISAARGEAEELAATVDARGAALSSASTRARSAARREHELSELLARGERRETRLEADVAAAEDELDAARERLRRASRVLADRLVAIYKSDAPDATGLLLDAEGFDDLATRAQLLDRIREADAALVVRVRDLRAEVAARLEEVTATERRVAEHNDRVAAAREEIAAIRSEAEAEAARLAAARERQQAALSQLQSQVGAWTSQVSELQQVSTEQAQQTVASWVGDWAIPQSIVMCESGGNFRAVNPSSGAGGAYQILPSTWELYGGEGAPQDASPGEQHRIASQIWRDSGSSAWVC